MSQIVSTEWGDHRVHKAVRLASRTSGAVGLSGATRASEYVSLVLKSPTLRIPRSIRPRRLVAASVRELRSDRSSFTREPAGDGCTKDGAETVTMRGKYCARRLESGRSRPPIVDEFVHAQNRNSAVYSAFQHTNRLSGPAIN
jgi:hypothetical protein